VIDRETGAPQFWQSVLKCYWDRAFRQMGDIITDAQLRLDTKLWRRNLDELANKLNVGIAENERRLLELHFRDAAIGRRLGLFVTGSARNFFKLGDSRLHHSEVMVHFFHVGLQRAELNNKHLSLSET